MRYEKHEMPAKFETYRFFAGLFPFLKSKALIDTITKNGKSSQYQMFWRFLNTGQTLSIDNLPNLDSIEFFEDDNIFKVTIIKEK